ncbi:helix-turn-helix domain-containing protein [Streptomyces carpaticus]|uniref:Helix-turn-helix domain-containing protein n=1 Tax=Streptomyces carpaticus TaxID=285558 RepID=A0ABV4ZNL0_9ACTN
MADDDAPAREFAEGLRALKERSGLSFGTLAKRLHLSTSTLHRYCSGAALPQEFAPADRLARACGASEEERRRLHRLWLLADARRAGTTAERAPGAAAAVTPEPEPAPAPAPPPAAPPPAPPARRSFPWRLTAGLVALLLAAVLTVDAASRAEADPAAAEPAPLTWTVRSHLWAFGCGHTYLIDAAPENVPPPPVAQDARRWSAERGGVHGDAAIVEVTLTPQPGAPVVVEAAHIRVAERREPLPWPAYRMDNGCGGSLTPAAFTVDLDADRPLAHPVPGTDAATGEDFPAPRLPFALDGAEPLLLRFEVRAATGDVDWSVDLDWSSGDRTGTLRVDDAGQPFRTSAATGPVYVHDVLSEEWLPQ